MYNIEIHKIQSQKSACIPVWYASLKYTFYIVKEITKLLSKKVVPAYPITNM